MGNAIQLILPLLSTSTALPNMVQRAATHIARKAVEMDIVPGRSPISVTAAAIYMASQASDQKRSQKEIGDIAGVADVTIRQSYKLMYPHASKLFPEDFKFTTPIHLLPAIWIRDRHEEKNHHRIYICLCILGVAVALLRFNYFFSSYF